MFERDAAIHEFFYNHAELIILCKNIFLRKTTVHRYQHRKKCYYTCVTMVNQYIVLFSVEGIPTVTGTSRYTGWCVVQENQRFPFPHTIWCWLPAVDCLLGRT